MSPRITRPAVTASKFAVSAVILFMLIQGARTSNAFSQLARGEKNWLLFGTAIVLLTASQWITFFRWHMLVRALDIPFRLRDAMRLGMIGFLFNFVSLGSVGGDLFKALFLAREQPGRRTLAVASVAIDRVVGLLAVFFVASITCLVTGLAWSEVPRVRAICQVTLILTVVGSVGFVAMLFPNLIPKALMNRVERSPKLGPIVMNLVQAMKTYRRRLDVLGWGLLMSMSVHALTTLGFFCLAKGLPGDSPGLGGHFVAVPLGIVASAVPLPLNGLGAFEGVLDFLYVNLPGSLAKSGQGFVVALAYRAVTMLHVVAAAIVYLTSRKKEHAETSVPPNHLPLPEMAARQEAESYGLSKLSA